MMGWLAPIRQFVLKSLQLYSTSGLFYQLPTNKMVAKLAYTILEKQI